MYEQGADIASLCTGAFLVAETDLLAGKVATTHWIAVDLFQRKYPNIQLLHEQIIVDAGRIYSCGGAMSFVNLIMYLVEKFCGSEIALLAAKMFLIDLNKGPQHSYAIFSTQKHHHDDEILRAQRWIETHYNKKLTVEKVAGHVAMSKRHFIRRFKHATGNTPLEYLQRVRVESVKKQLEAGKGSIETIVRSVGYDDMASFRKIFIRHTGLSPTEYRRRYERRNMIAVA